MSSTGHQSCALHVPERLTPTGGAATLSFSDFSDFNVAAVRLKLEDYGIGTGSPRVLQLLAPVHGYVVFCWQLLHIRLRLMRQSSPAPSSSPHHVALRPLEETKQNSMFCRVFDCR